MQVPFRPVGRRKAERSFEVKEPEDDLEKAVHAERLALLSFRHRKFDETRRLAEQAVKADPTSTSPQRVRMLMAQAAACLATDDLKAAVDVFRRILKVLPADGDLAALCKHRLEIIEKEIARRASSPTGTSQPAP